MEPLKYSYGNCSWSEITIHPLDWDQPNSDTSIEWYIQYRFRDPQFGAKYPDGKYCTNRKGVNEARSVIERRKRIKKLKEETQSKLLSGYNPITRRIQKANTRDQQPGGGLVNDKVEFPNPKFANPYIQEIQITEELIVEAEKYAWEVEKRENLEIDDDKGKVVVYILHPDMTYIDALWKAYRKVKGVPGHLSAIRGCIRKMTKAAYLLSYLPLKISEIQPQHILSSFDVLYKTNPKFTTKTQNKQRSYLFSLFRELAISRAVLSNFISELPILPKIIAQAVLLENDELRTIDEFIKANDYYYWRWLNLFYTSGSREIEFCPLKYSQVNLIKREFKLWQRKGGIIVEVIKPIPIFAVRLWKEVLTECEELAREHDCIDYLGEICLFGKGIRPAFVSIGRDNFIKRWRILVKEELGIQKELYKLKHLYTDRVAAALSLQHSMEQTSHTQEETVLIYAVNERARRREELKNLTLPLNANYQKVSDNSLQRRGKALSYGQLDLLSASCTMKVLKLTKRLINCEETILLSHGFDLLLKKGNNFESQLGKGTIYTFSQGVIKNSIWISSVVIEILIIDGVWKSGNVRVPVKCYTLYIKQNLFLEQYALKFNNEGKIKQLLKGYLSDNNRFTERVIPQLVEIYESSNTYPPGE